MNSCELWQKSSFSLLSIFISFNVFFYLYALIFNLLIFVSIMTEYLVFDYFHIVDFCP